MHRINQLYMAYEHGEYGEQHHDGNIPEEFISDITDIILKHYDVDKQAASEVIKAIFFRTSIHSFGDDIRFVLEQHKKLCKQ